jgi:hypothetical protein
MILASTGAGYYILKNASDLGESLFQSSGQAFNLRFHIWVLRFVAIWAFGFSGFILFILIASTFFGIHHF